MASLLFALSLVKIAKIKPVTERLQEMRNDCGLLLLYLINELKMDAFKIESELESNPNVQVRCMPK